jgi:Two component regulator propeller
MRRRVRIGFALVAFAAAAAAAAWLSAIRRADSWLAEATRRDPARAAEIAVHAAPAVAWDRPRDGASCITSPDEVRDGGLAGGRTLVATAGGLVPYRAGQRPPRPYTHLDGLSGVDLTAAAPLGGRLLLGDSTGRLTLVDGERAVALRLDLPRAGAIADLAPAGDTVYALVTGVGVVAFDGRRAIEVGASLHADLAAASALCAGPRGLAVGTADGQLWAERAGALTRLPAALRGERVTALACDGDALLAGTPFGLTRVAAGRAEPIAADLFVTSILPTDGALFVATFDDGVRLLDPDTGRERAHHLAGRRVHRLRRLDDRVVAFGPGGPWVFTGGAFAPLGDAPSAGLSGGHVTALARDGAGALWVGTFEHGIDLLGPDLAPQRRPTAPPKSVDARDDQVNALLYRPATRDMLAATVHGLDAFGPSGLVRLPAAEHTELAGQPPDAIAAVAATPTGLALAGARGVTLIDGARTRTLYAFHGLANNHVYALAWRDGRLYAGTLGGLSIIQNDKVFKNIGAGPRGLRAAWVTALAAAPEGVYAGTYGGGVQLVREGGAVEDLPAPGGRFHVNPGALALDGNTLWVGTLESGLLAWDRTAHAWRKLDAGLLPSLDVTALLVEGDAVYVGTEAGLVRLPRTMVEGSLVSLGNREGSS